MPTVEITLYGMQFEWDDDKQILGRVPNSEQVSFNGLKMPKSGKTS